jgi:hypothetical protein
VKRYLAGLSCRHRWWVDHQPGIDDEFDCEECGQGQTVVDVFERFPPPDTTDWKAIAEKYRVALEAIEEQLDDDWLRQFVREALT